jgi:uncharacterized membrane protein (DUF373 family)
MREKKDEAFVDFLRRIVDWAVRALAVLMVFVIVMGVADVVWVLYQRLTTPPRLLLQISDILETFGAFIAVLIAIEIFVNITVYLRQEVIHVQIVMATALLAVARKIIVLDFQVTPALYVFALAAVTLAISVGYWLAVVGPGRPRGSRPRRSVAGRRRPRTREPPAAGPGTEPS